ncbi:MAG: hypothetical protein K6T31_08170 [Alicyclobacillus sp.]|nr:hypothetical protein [Alicyclobacillus sp.]MCL6636819.1 hypothetical protein [Alicyclobacillus sp.]
MGWRRTLASVVVGGVVLALLMVFLNVAIKLALLAALIAFAFYWFTRAAELWRRRRPW